MSRSDEVRAQQGTRDDGKKNLLVGIRMANALRWFQPAEQKG